MTGLMLLMLMAAAPLAMMGGGGDADEGDAGDTGTDAGGDDPLATFQETTFIELPESEDTEPSNEPSTEQSNGIQHTGTTNGIDGPEQLSVLDSNPGEIIFGENDSFVPLTGGADGGFSGSGDEGTGGSAQDDPTGNAGAGDPDPADPNPVDPNPVDPNPVDPNPTDPDPVDPNPVDPDPVDPDPVDPDPADPDPVDPDPADPDPSDPDPADPDPVDPNPANPDPVDPDPVDPDPADPDPVDPDPIEVRESRLSGDADNYQGDPNVIHHVHLDGGNDTAYGGDYDDIIQGGVGGDNIYGGLGDDILYATDMQPGSASDAETDLLNGGLGNDTIMIGDLDAATGGDGEDTFVIQHDMIDETTIVDFNADDDIILVQSADPESMSIQFQAQLDNGVLVVLSNGAGIYLADATEPLSAGSLAFVEIAPIG